MKTTLTRESASKIRLVVEASSDEVRPAVERAVKHLSDQVKVPGFRKGKVPRQILETRVGRDALREATLREAVPELVAQAVAGEEIEPIAPPSVEVTSYDLDADLAFEATVEVRPEIELPDLTTLSATRGATNATPEEIESQLERARDRFATLEAVERAAARGDFALIDLTTTLNDQTIEQLSGTDQLYEIGSESIVPEIDSELEGKRAGDILRFNATLPEVGPPEWAGKEVTFGILVKEIRRKVLPDLDDEFAKTASEFETLDELKADIAERVKKVKAAQADSDVRTRLLEALVDEIDVEVPESLVNEEMTYRFRRFEEQLQGAGMTLEAWIESQGVTEDQLEADLRKQGERNVRAQLVLDEIARREEFKISEDELRDEVRYHAEMLRTDPSQLAQALNDRGRLAALAGDIIRRKALNHIVEQADITEEDPPADVPTAAGEQES